MRITHQRDKGAVKINFSGELGHHEAMQTIKYIENVITLYSPSSLELNLKEMNFMDSSGIAVIMYGFRNMREVGADFFVSDAPKQAKKVLHAAKLDKIMKIV